MQFNVLNSSYQLDIGLFATVVSGTKISDVKISNISIDRVSTSSNAIVVYGGIAVNNVGKILYCETSGDLDLGSIYFAAGGICNSNSGSITHCINRTNIATKKYVGGICRSNSGAIDSCINYGELYYGLSGGQIVSDGSKVTNCSEEGTLAEY